MMTFDEIKNDAQGVRLTIFDTDYPAVFTNGRINKRTVPSEYHCYDIRESDNSDRFCEIADNITVNHAGSVITKRPIDFHDYESACDDDFEYGFDDDILSEFEQILSDI